MTSNPYDRPSDPAKRHSAALTDGPDRAAGAGDAEGDRLHRRRPRASPWSASPRRGSRRCRATSTSASWPQRVKAGIRAAGGTPMEFNTISISDGVSMGTEGMKASLVSRELIADSIELVVRGHLMDGARLHRRLRQDHPGRRDGALPARRARARALQRHDRAGHVPRPRHHHPGRLRGGRRLRRRARSTRPSCTRSSRRACPGAGACGGQFTANTMSMALDFLGISPAGLNGIPALNRGKGDAAEECGRLAMQLVRDDIRPSHDRHPRGDRERGRVGRGHRRLDQRRAAPARDRARARTSRSRSTSSTRSPSARRSSPSLKPGGKFVATDMFDAGGVALVARELLKRDLVHAGARNVDGRTMGEIADEAAETPGQPVVVPIETPLKADRRPRHPARQPLARRLRRQAGRPRAPLPPRPGARVRLRGGLLRRGQGRRDPAPATSS